MNINELLDELETAHCTFGPITSDIRAKIDAAIRRMDDRISELEKQKSYVYIGRDGKAVLARELEDRLVSAEEKIAAYEEGVDVYDVKYFDAFLLEKKLVDAENRISELEAEKTQLLVNLATRDGFMVGKDLWGEFTSQLPTRAEFEAMIAEEMETRALANAGNESEVMQAD